MKRLISVISVLIVMAMVFSLNIIADDMILDNNATATEDISETDTALQEQPLLMANTIASGPCGENVTWTLSSDGLLTISGTGPMEEYVLYSVDPPWISYRNSIKSAVIENGVTTISSYTFYWCTNLTDIAIPDSVTAIGRCAFLNCVNLPNLTLSKNVESIGYLAFSGCTSMDGLTILSETVEIYDNASTITPRIISYSGSTAEAYANKYSKKFTIIHDEHPLGDWGIYDDYCHAKHCTFDNCPYFETEPHSFDQTHYCTVCGEVDPSYGDGGVCGENLTWLFTREDGVLRISGTGKMTSMPWRNSYTMSINSVILEEGVTEICSFAFASCSNITSITIPNSVTNIDSSAFAYCMNLESITFGTGLKTIKDYVFDQSTNLKNIYISDLAAWCSIDADSMPSNYDLYINGELATDIIIPENVQEISSGAFKGCVSLTGVKLHDGITRIGAGAFSGCKNLKGITIPSTVTAIGSGAFLNCKCLTSITIPSSVTSIGSYAFEGCARLTDAVIGNGVTALPRSVFEDCTSLKSVTIPASVTEIGYYAFSNCTSLEDVYISDIVAWCVTSFDLLSNPLSFADNLYLNGELVTDVTVPETVEKLSNYAFGAYNKLASITFKSSTTTLSYNSIPSTTTIRGYLLSKAHTFAETYGFNFEIIQSDGPIYTGVCGENAIWEFYSDGTLIIKGTGDIVISSDSYGTYKKYIEHIIIEDGITSIPNNAFYLYPILKDVTVGKDVKTIGERAFGDCESLISIELPNGLESIGNEAFSSCDQLLSIEIPDSVTNLGDTVFINCKALTTVVFGEGITRVPETTFLYCVGLKNVTFKGDITAIGKRAFSGTRLETFTIPDTVTSIGLEAFHGCISLKTVTIPNSVKTIGESAFENCSSLTSITIPDSVTSIGGYTFYKCTELKTATLPKGITTIGTDMFRDCVNLESVNIPDNVTIIYDGAFNKCKKLKRITIPEGVDTIGGWAFSECSSLTEVIIPESVKKVGQCAFQLCTSLSKITFKSEATEIYDYDLTIYRNVVIYGYQDSTAEAYAKKYNRTFRVLPHQHSYGPWEYHNKEEHIRRCKRGNCELFETQAHTFDNTHYCTVCGCLDPKYIALGTCGDGLTWILTSEGVLTISGEGAMSDYSPSSSAPWSENAASIRSLVIKDGVTSIGSYAFADCSNLRNTVVPESVESVGESAFANCSSMGRITFKSENVSIFDSPDTIPASAVIRGHIGSTAQAYAVEYDREFIDLGNVLLGDVDGNDEVDNNDAIYLLYYTIFGEEGGYTVNQNCDFNGDGVIDNNDAIYLLYHTIFGETEYPLS